MAKDNQAFYQKQYADLLWKTKQEKAAVSQYEAIALHNQLVYRVSTSLFTQPDNERLEDLATRIKTGALNVNRATIGASLRLPSVGLGRASNGIPAGIDILRFLSTPRAMLLERRPFDPTQVVPGVNWDAPDTSSDADVTHALIPESG